jgi:hypothetical protein
VAVAACEIAGMLVPFPYRDPGEGFLGVKNWLFGTVCGVLAGMVTAPWEERRKARALFIAAAVCIPAGFLARGLLAADFKFAHLSALLQAIVGGAVAWGLSRKA